MRMNIGANFAIALLIASCIPPDSARAQDGVANPIGKVIDVAGSVTVAHVNPVPAQVALPGQADQTRPGDLVYQGDIVQTGADGRLSINFADGTSFNLASNARMTLDEFVYDPNGRNNSTLFNIAKGTVTFVAGRVAKTGDMKINTPVATMGVRGTTPHVEVMDDGSVRFSTLLEMGKSKVANRLGSASDPSLKSDPKPQLNICRGC
ncbi:FecR domain-containing protein [uncultured Bradyrhizobium sp.]|jgi:hypothetical protein|uniref:FecR family protein n=1 Tax=uncultured Bradyrhizobium sp. TaxID=199684 RepID=UPI0026156BEB|nr:FecR domain-containing protein [uncultured Bradyrhizobium sp.]